MAPTVAPDVVVLQAWEVFTALKNGQPVLGGKLYTYEAGTTTPKAAYHDAFVINPHANPIIMNDQGQAVIWLEGFYRLVLTDAEGVQLWEIDNYAFASGAPAVVAGLVSGMTEATPVTPSAGAGTILVPNLVPVGYRVEGIIVRIDAEFGMSNGLTGLAIGDTVSLDRWGVVLPTLGQQTSQIDFRSADRPLAATAYSVLLRALGGNFDTAGACTVRAFWSSITGWT